jgi:tellurite resistance protein TerC
VLPFTESYSGEHFFVRSLRGTLMATPLFLVLLVIEWTDLVFAIDSIPAVFAVTRDPFIVYSSNIFAILGLRALFFVLADMMHRFDYLKPAIAVILIFVGIKMLVSNWIHLPTLLSLGFIVISLATGVLLSLRKTRREAMRIAG